MYSAVAAGTANYYIKTGAPSHFVNEVDALHDYIPFETPRAITTAESGTIRTYGTGTLKFATVVDGKEVTGEFQSVYYIPDIHTRLISVGKLFSKRLLSNSSDISFSPILHALRLNSG